jgi:hypothetical protein
MPKKVWRPYTGQSHPAAMIEVTGSQTIWEQAGAEKLSVKLSILFSLRAAV